MLDFGRYQLRDGGEWFGMLGYLLETDEGERILVDTGLAVSHLDGIGERERLSSFFGRLEFERENLVTGQLAKLGLFPADIDLVVITHGGVDRAGGLDQLTGVPVIISREARRQPPRPPASPLPEREYREFEGDFELRPGIQLLATSGHARGHVSLLVRLPLTGSVVLAVHAIGHPGELEQGFRESASEEQVASATRLVELAEAEDAMLVYGYDTDQGPTVRKAPEFYD